MSGEKKREGKKQAFDEYQEQIPKVTIIKDLCNAARAGDLGKIKQLLAKDPSALNGTSPDQVPLLWALKAPTNEVFLYLLSINADTSLPLPSEKSWPQRIIFDGRWPCDQVLEVLNMEPFTGLEDHLLAAFRGYDLFRLIFRTRIPDNLGNNIAHYASASGNLRLLKQLKARRKWLLLAPNYEGTTPFLTAVQCGQTEISEWFLKNGLVNTKEEGLGDSCIQLAARAGSEDFIKKLIIDFGIDPGDTMQIARLLMEANGEPTDDNNKELLALAEELRNLYIDYYLIQQASVNHYIETGETLKHEEVVQLTEAEKFKKENKEQEYLRAGLPFEIIEPLKEIMADYIPPYTEEQLQAPNKIIQENTQILRPLKTYIDECFPHDAHVIKVLYLRICRLKDLNAATIRQTVENFKLTPAYKNTLGVNKKIIDTVLLNTEPFAPKKQPPTKQSAFSGIFSFLTGDDSKASAPKEGKRIPESGVDTSEDAVKKQNASAALIAKLTPLTGQLQWTANGHGGAQAKCNTRATARIIKLFLHENGYSNSVLELGDDAEKECYLNVYAPKENLTQSSEPARPTATSTSNSSTHFQPLKGVEPSSSSPKREAKNDSEKTSGDLSDTNSPQSIELTDLSANTESSSSSKPPGKS